MFCSNISSCVLSNGFSTQPFAVERGVRQGDPLSAFFVYYGFRDFMHQYTQQQRYPWRCSRQLNNQLN